MLNAIEIMELQKLAGMDKFSKRTVAEELERQKLIELISDAIDPKERLVLDGAIRRMTDHLIANDVVIEVHAHWEDGCAIHNGKEVYQSIDCSHCEEIFKIESETREYWKARFKVCPFCGAVMDGGNEDG